MDGERFDAITRTLATGGSRRTLLRAFAGAIGASLAGVGTALGAPRCKRTGQRCKSNADCCPDTNGNLCAANKTCQPCPAETPTLCGTQCRNTDTDAGNCGACGERCPTGASCVGGGCVCPSDAPSICAGKCVDKSDDNLNCGSCGVQCFGDSTCVNGGCRCFYDGQHIDDDGLCTCEGTTCVSSDDCCNDFYTGRFMCTAGQCTACTPPTFTVDDPATALPCCDGAFFPLGNTGSIYICVSQCESDEDCVGFQICPDDPSTSPRYCGCPAGMSIDGIGGCSCTGTACTQDADCCAGFACDNGYCFEPTS